MSYPKSVAAIVGLTLLSIYGNQVLASPASQLLKHLSKFGVREGAGNIAKDVGPEVFERAATKVFKEGGEESVVRLGRLTAKHGADVIRAAENSPAPARLLRALDELSDTEVATAAARLAAGPQGRKLAELTLRYGAPALRAEVAHPGIGGKFIRAFGTSGAVLCQQMTADQAVAIGRHVDEIAKLPPSQRKAIFDLISKQTNRFVQFVGRFLEKNPGKVLFTAATTAVTLSNAERVLGGDEILFDAHGNPFIVSKAGIIERQTKPVVEALAWSVRNTIAAILAICSLTVVVWVGKQFGFWKQLQQFIPSRFGKQIGH